MDVKCAVFNVDVLKREWTGSYSCAILSTVLYVYIFIGDYMFIQKHPDRRLLDISYIEHAKLEDSQQLTPILSSFDLKKEIETFCGQNTFTI